MPATEDVERHIAVAVVVAVEEPPFLLAVQRIVSRVEIEDDFRRGASWPSRNSSTNSRSIAAASWPILW